MLTSIAGRRVRRVFVGTCEGEDALSERRKLENCKLFDDPVKNFTCAALSGHDSDDDEAINQMKPALPETCAAASAPLQCGQSSTGLKLVNVSLPLPMYFDDRAPAPVLNIDGTTGPLKRTKYFSCGDAHF
jgi:hypothetical protein